MRLRNAGLNTPEIRTILKQGRGSMPSLQTRLSPDEMTELAEWLVNWQQDTPNQRSQSR